MLKEVLNQVLDILIDVSSVIWALAILGIPVLWVYVTVMERREARYEAELLQAVERIKIADNVTLLQGVQAYFGPDAHWFVLGDFVRILGSVLGPSIQVRIVPVEGGPDRQEWRAWGINGEMAGDEITDLLNTMAAAVERQGTVLKM